MQGDYINIHWAQNYIESCGTTAEAVLIIFPCTSSAKFMNTMALVLLRMQQHCFLRQKALNGVRMWKPTWTLQGNKPWSFTVLASAHLNHTFLLLNSQKQGQASPQRAS